MGFKGIQTASKGMSFFNLLKKVLLFIVVISLIFNVIHAFKQDPTLSSVIKKLGGELFNPFYNLNSATTHISVNGLYPNNGFFFTNIWGFLKNLYFFFLPIINLYFVFSYLFLFVREVLLGDSSRNFPAFTVTMIIFFLLNLVYIATFTKLPLDTPITALKNTFNLIYGMFN